MHLGFPPVLPTRDATPATDVFPMATRRYTMPLGSATGIELERRRQASLLPVANTHNYLSLIHI